MATTETATWVLTDGYGSQFGDHEYPRIAIHSPEHLKAVLEEFARAEPRLLNLDAPDGFRVGVAIGGPLGVVEVYGREDGARTLTAVADAPQATEPRCFVGDWQPSYFLPRYLLPVGDVVRIVLDLYRTQHPPDWVRWEG